MEGSADISIGPDKWINWVELDPLDKNLFEIDDYLEPVREFWLRLETDCMAECCGIDAFVLWPENIRFAAANLDVDYLKACFERLREEIIQSDCKIVNSKRLNNLFDKKVFLQLIDHIRSCLQTVRNK
jgi:hypothetical protein